MTEVTEGAGVRIFVVDDNECVADLISIVLCRAGFQVVTFYDALPALHHALEARPDAVVTDYSMPHMNGLEFAAWLQDHFPDCKIVILTGDVASVTEEAAGDVKFTLLEKPAHPDELITAVRQ